MFSFLHGSKNWRTTLVTEDAAVLWEIIILLFYKHYWNCTFIPSCRWRRSSTFLSEHQYFKLWLRTGSTVCVCVFAFELNWRNNDAFKLHTFHCSLTFLVVAVCAFAVCKCCTCCLERQKTDSCDTSPAHQLLLQNKTDSCNKDAQDEP